MLYGLEGLQLHELQKDESLAVGQGAVVEFDVVRSLQPFDCVDAHFLDGRTVLQELEHLIRTPPNLDVLGGHEGTDKHSVEVEHRRAEVIGLLDVVLAVNDRPILVAVRAHLDLAVVLADDPLEVFDELDAFVLGVLAFPHQAHDEVVTPRRISGHNAPLKGVGIEIDRHGDDEPGTARRGGPEVTA
eukprot:CAMPEP_0117538742 /NCGR_PEP_ID=MMETSP0784-20121206/42634_1 /TAXON_ID=39447 /ORGANISM="" /LENGTH=186 /DNA_ID=CAMNT_0005335363 /DNA_START=448 /DNA_END=1005 /DNA_ORIENTATION=-